MRSRSRRRGPGKVGTAIFVVASLLFSAGIGAVAYYLPVLSATVAATGHVADLPSPVASAVAATPQPPGAPFTVLLLGSDNDEKFVPDHLLTQSMILVRVDPGSKKVSMLSIPRDLYVPLSVGGSSRIDEAYSYGGASAAIATVERNFHVHVDAYIWIGLKGLIDVIDKVGGVDVITSNPVLDDYYPGDINTDNPFGYYRVAVLPGPQHLDGYHALEYVRSRHSDLRGDFGRSQRQQQVLTALRAKAGQVRPEDLPALADALKDEVKTSLSIPQMIQLLPVAAGLSPDEVNQIVLFGDYTYGQNVNGADVQIPNWNLILPLVHQTFPSA